MDISVVSQSSIKSLLENDRTLYQEVTHFLRGWLKRSVVAKGYHYAQNNRVLDIQMADHKTLLGKVRGRGTAIYDVKLTLSDMDSYHRYKIQNQCSCPQDYSCKHVAALVYSWAALLKSNNSDFATMLEEQQPDVTYHTNQWLSQVEKQLSRMAASTDDQAKPSDVDEKKMLVYLLSRHFESHSGYEVAIETYQTKRPKNGRRKLEKNRYFPKSQAAWDKLSTVDQDLLKNLLSLAKSSPELYYQIPIYKLSYFLTSPGYFNFLVATPMDYLLTMLLRSGRCYWEKLSDKPLQASIALSGTLSWVKNEEGLQEIRGNCESAGKKNLILLPLSPLWYVDIDSGEMGHFNTDLSSTLVCDWASAPPLNWHEAKALHNALGKQSGLDDNTKRTLPLPQTYDAIEVQSGEPEPMLTLGKEDNKNISGSVYFKYHDTPVKSEAPGRYVEYMKGNTLIRVPRDRKKEREALAELAKIHEGTMATAIPSDPSTTTSKNPLVQLMPSLRKAEIPHRYAVGKAEDKKKLLHYQGDTVERLTKAGWQVDFGEDYPLEPPLEVEDWFSDLEDSEYDWFSFRLGVTVDGESINLLPYILPALEAGENTSDSPCMVRTGKGSKAVVHLHIPDKGSIRFPAARFDAIVNLVTALNKKKGSDDFGLDMTKSALLAEAVSAFEADQLRWHGDKRLLQIGERLRHFKKLRVCPPPKTFQGQLRKYQQGGVNWLQFLREYGLQGILADDMGLGKTVQTIAHLCIEKSEGRCEHPTLIVAPTSALGNWQAECKRFAPHLRTQLWHGSQRHQETLGQDVDIVMTNYSLVLRDKDLFCEQTFYYLILDEAQAIKNAKAKISYVMRQLKASHRMCLTGTPMENHLGELWSLFHFLMPGLLGQKETFVRCYRTPIEKKRDSVKSDALKQLVKPFILRRTKQGVVKDLPKKTEVIQRLPLEVRQRDVYEGVRMAMHKKVREALDRQGVERSHILVLDALLKLRQLCCHPQLLKLPEAQALTHSPKLAHLMDMLATLVAEEHHILIFSQFTTMLSLIEKAIKEKGYSYRKLTGSSTNRQQLIDDFQSGEVSIFLISLKAGGTGLNLTKADTVIHYDPWWNPAVEQQATDRAYRIGQKQPVTVYKLIMEDTIEEKLLKMQAKKQALTGSVLQGQTNRGALTRSDIEWLLG